MEAIFTSGVICFGLLVSLLVIIIIFVAFLPVEKTKALKEIFNALAGVLKSFFRANI